jgi:hypothetical protein
MILFVVVQIGRLDFSMNGRGSLLLNRLAAMAVATEMHDVGLMDAQRLH